MGYPYTFEITVPSGTVAANLTNFPVMVDLSDMPNYFWDYVLTNGENIRVYTSGDALVPHDVVRVDSVSKQGFIFFLVASLLTGSDNTFKIKLTSDTAKLAVGNANGRNAVWTDYDGVWMFGETGGDDRTGNNSMGRIYGDPYLFEIDSTSSTDLDSHQGVDHDGTYYYTTDTNAIYKWNSAWTQVASNADPIGDANIGGTPTVNHCGDVCCYDDKLYIPMEAYPAVGGVYNGHIGVFNASDLSFIESFDIHAQAHESASIAYCPTDGYLYVVDYDGNNSTIYKYNPSNGNYIGALTTDKAIPNRQGITWWRDHFWVSQDANDETLRVSYTGEVSTGNLAGSSGGLFGEAVAGSYEGIGHTTEALLQLADPGAVERVDVWKPKNITMGAGGGFRNKTGATSNMRCAVGGSYTVFTIGCTVIFDALAANRAFVSYWDESSGTSNSNRVTLAFSNTNASIGVWDTNNSWLLSSPKVNPSTGTAYRVNVTYNGTTNRTIQVNAGSKGTDAVITAAPANKDTLLVAQEDTSQNEPLVGSLGFLYLRTDLLSDDFIQAEYDNLNAPSNFYEISMEVQADPITVALTPNFNVFDSGAPWAGTSVNITLVPRGAFVASGDWAASPIGITVTPHSLGLVESKLLPASHIPIDIGFKPGNPVLNIAAGTTFDVTWIGDNLGEGPWDLVLQKDKWGYLNNPNWTGVEGVAEFIVRVGLGNAVDLEDQHRPCGHWHRRKVLDTEGSYADLPAGQWVAAMDQDSTPNIYLYDITYRSAIKIDTSYSPPEVIQALTVNASGYSLDYNKGYGTPGHERGGHCISKDGNTLWYLFRGTGANEGDYKLVEVDISGDTMSVTRTTILSSLLAGGTTINDGCADATYTWWCAGGKDGLKSGRIIKIRNSDHAVIDNHDFGYAASPDPSADEGIQSVECHPTEDKLYWAYVRSALHETPSKNARYYHILGDKSMNVTVTKTLTGSGFSSPQWQDKIKLMGSWVYYYRNYYPAEGYFIQRYASNITYYNYDYQAGVQDILGTDGDWIFIRRSAQDGDPSYLTKIRVIGLNNESTINVDAYTHDISLGSPAKWYSDYAVSAFCDYTGKIMLFRWHSNESKNYGATFNKSFALLNDQAYTQIYTPGAGEGTPLADDEPVLWPLDESNWDETVDRWDGSTPYS